VAGFAAAARQIASKLAPTAFGQNQEVDTCTVFVTASSQNQKLDACTVTTTLQPESKTAL
jgi:hypothetical protein